MRKKKPKKAPAVGIKVGVAWYTREQWDRLREVSADPGSLADTYEDWVRFAKKSLKQLEEEGIHPEKIEMDVDELVKWCRARDRKVEECQAASRCHAHA